MSMFLDNTSAHNLEDIFQLFGNLFSSVYSINKLPDDILEFLNFNIHEININSMTISEDEILDYLMFIDDKSPTGPDGPPILLKKRFSVLVKPLHYLFNPSLSTGVFPSFLKKIIYYTYT
jgi:hypothetical protein